MSGKMFLDDCLAVLLLAALYPVWSYCASRWTANGEEAACLPLLLIFLLWAGRIREETASPASDGTAHRLGKADFAAMSGLLAVYVLTYHHAFMLVRAIFAFAALGVFFSRRLKGRMVDMPVCGLLFLSLPAIPTAQFYFGYPLRVMVAKSAAAMLKLVGYDVFSSGTAMFWDGQCVSVDAPCSGIRMLYAGMLIVLLFAYFRNLSWKGLFLLSIAGTAAVICGNIVRASALFFTESGIVPFAGGFLHTAIGLSAFIWIMAGICLAAKLIAGRREMCVAA